MLDSIIKIESELKKLRYKPAWKRKQCDSWDVETNFIYHTPLFKDVVMRSEQIKDGLIRDYAINRWFNFWSAKGVETIFDSCIGVEKCLNEKSREVDFYIQKIPFDHKTTVFPKQFEKGYNYAKANKEALIRWLYTNQSKQQRCHYANKLFIVLYNKKGAHWQLRKELQKLQPLIQDYITNFSPDKLISITPSAVSDILWFEE